MLFNFFITFEFRKFCQSGGYFDFFYKQLTEMFIRNFFIFTATYIGEKYMIETWTKKITEKCISYINSFLGWTYLSYFNFFLNILVLLLYSFSLINLFLLLF